jgi:2-amino-4-hydroxy-6-hydroxymethyldihydropteridine diphosphokinase
MRHLSSQNLVLGLGSNAQQEKHFLQVLDALKAHFGDVVVSSVYQGLPVDYPPLAKGILLKETGSTTSSPSYYYNAVVVVQSELAIEEIKKITRDIEQHCGRDRTTNVSTEMVSDAAEVGMIKKVTMDIDCLLYGERVNSLQDTRLPHENVLTMAYVLRPLAELLPDVLHLESNKTFAELWNEMANQHHVLLEPIDFVWQNL